MNRFVRVLLGAILAGTLALAPRAASLPSSEPLPGDNDPAAKPRAASCGQPGGCGAPISLSFRDGAPTGLPSARVKQPYFYRFHLWGGQPPYRLRLSGGALPSGMLLGADGTLAGISPQPGRSEFTLEGTDRAGQTTRETFALFVRDAAPDAHVFRHDPGPLAKRPSPPASPAQPQAAAQVAKPPAAPPPANVRRETQTDDGLVTYILDAETLKQLKPSAPAVSGGERDAAALAAEVSSFAGQDAPPAAGGGERDAAPLGLDPAGVKLLQQILQSMVGVEYPTRGLFADALDYRVCHYAEVQADKAGGAVGGATPGMRRWERKCAQAWSGGASVDELTPARLMPQPIRLALINQSRHPHPFPLLATPPSWLGAGCNCLRSATQGQAIGFFPGWHPVGKSQNLNFALYERVVMMAQPIDDEGNVATPQLSNEQSDFFRAAGRYGSSLDFTLYRGDWAFLDMLDANNARYRGERAAQQAVRLIDTPLSSLKPAWQDGVPLLISDDTLADGLVLYLANAPKPGEARYPRFDAFRDQLVRSLIAQLRQSKRKHGLTLLIDGEDLVPREVLTGELLMINKDMTWPLSQLADYLQLAEEPPQGQGGADGLDPYVSSTNLSLKVVPMLPEPLYRTKKALRYYVDSSRSLPGNLRAIFLRRLLPLVSLGGSDPTMFADDMVYLNYNFGGVTLWPKPVTNPQRFAMQARAVQTAFLGNEPPENAVCDFVCDWRWGFRVVGTALVLAALISLGLYLFSCRFRALGRPYQLYLLGVCIAPMIVAGLLMRCDPDLNEAMLSQRLLILILLAFVLSLLFRVLKPKVDSP
ncbi:Ig domain-containing protein [Chromobacterium subtsugae]|uniref:Ig domain-containing protein n=1 Tax=Chromobacterium subtsugae TaxID=251747 RepID=UPI000A800396|nr:Ig domain-containing protein [Chromobacterium subtsugae]